MEGGEDALPSYSSGSTDQAGGLLPPAAKRRRTRRHRNGPPAASANTVSSSASSTEESGFTDDEGMANCLILLAQGGGAASTPAGKFTSKRFAEAAATTTGGRAAGFYVYECKTCNKCFPSFQALGGHRASHKKLKMASEAAAAAAAGEKKGVLDEVDLRISMKRTEAVGKGKIHECSICGSEFSSGQALGGHMRRHRPAVEVPDEFKKEKNVVLALDLNLPAPVEDDGSFAIPGKPLVFSPAAAAALVDCYY